MKAKRILLLDNEAVFLESIKNYILEKNKMYEIAALMDYDDSLNKMRNESFDLLILGVRKPIDKFIKLLNQLIELNIWLPLIVLSHVGEADIQECKSIFLDFGIVDFLENPLNLETLDKKIAGVLEDMYEPTQIYKQPEISKILNQYESQRKTGVLTINLGDAYGRLFIKKGKILDVRHHTFLDEESATHNGENIREKKPEYNWQQMLRGPGSSKTAAASEELPEQNSDSGKITAGDLPDITNLLNSVKELDDFIITDIEGTVHITSSDKINEGIVNKIIYVFVIGKKVGEIMKAGQPLSITHILKSKKLIILIYPDYIYILFVKATIKLGTFKEKLSAIFPTKKKALDNNKGI